MPTIGEIRLAREIGYHSGHNYIWQGCSNCGKQRWVQLVRGVPIYELCNACAGQTRARLGQNNYNWKGGTTKDNAGYILVRLFPGDFFYPMVNNKGYVREHRLVFAKSMGRCLHPWELVHHINGNKSDNRLRNLQLVQEMQHKQITMMESRIAQLEKRITLLEAENVLLKAVLTVEQRQEFAKEVQDRLSML